MDESQIPVQEARVATLRTVIPFVQLLEKAKSDRDRNQLGGCRGRMRGPGTEGTGESGGDALFYSLIVVVVPWLYAFVKTHRTVH